MESRSSKFREWWHNSNPESHYSRRAIFVYTSTFFIVIATVLGTGILGVPAKLARTGFWPFFLSYTICFVFQALILVYTVELLQRAKALHQSGLVHDEEDDHLVGAPMGSSPHRVSSSEQVELETLDQAHNPDAVRTTKAEHVDLHAMGKLFLSKRATKFFDFAIMLQFISILISYALAGSQAYGSLTGVNYQILILPFVLACTAVVIFGSNAIQAIISVMTFTKGSVLVLVVLITMVVGEEANHDSTSNFIYIGKPLLISTVALGGAVNLVPVCFTKVHPTRTELRYFVTAILAGLFFVYILNVAWCYYILKIVPQLGDISLESAEKAGQIATIPLIKIIRLFYPQYRWIATVIDVFIMLSITVSFITMSTGMKHVLEGFATSSSGHGKPMTSLKAMLQRLSPTYKKILLYLVSFGLIYLIAQTNPTGFHIVLEYFTSFGLNLEAGVFISWMLGNARSKHQIDVAFDVSYWIYKLRYLVIFYFSFAMFYDIAIILTSLIVGYP